jgi:hypothetical protein
MRRQAVGLAVGHADEAGAGEAAEDLLVSRRDKAALGFGFGEIGHGAHERDDLGVVEIEILPHVLTRFDQVER